MHFYSSAGALPALKNFSKFALEATKLEQASGMQCDRQGSGRDGDATELQYGKGRFQCFWNLIDIRD